MKNVAPRHRSSSLALFAVWYVAAALMNAPLQRDAFANAGRTDYTTRRTRRRLAQHGAAEAARAASDRRRARQAGVETPPTSKRSLVYHATITLQETLIGFFFGAALGIGLAVLVHRRCAASSVR